MKAAQEFFNLYNHDFVRVAVALPALKVADPTFNGFQTVEMMAQAAERNALVVLFPELGVSAYSCEDLFHQRALLEGCRVELARIVKASESMPVVSVVGAPIQVDHLLFNCAVVIHRGRSWAWCRKPTCPTTGNFMSCGNSLRQTTR